jgi:sugar/nucleoside kinase (ribokinase family)
VRLAVTGSIATDHLLTFPGRFAEQILADKLEKISLSFLADSLEIRRGGVAANIAFGLGSLGRRPLLVGTVGPDFSDYREWLEAHGVDTSGVRQSVLHHTARFIGTTDADLNQIATFYPGAMSEDSSISLGDLPGPVDLVLVGAGDPAAMRGFTQQCRSDQIAFAADTSQQLAYADGDMVRDLLDGAAYLFSNEYEAELTEHKTGWSSDEVLARVGVRVTTLGEDGARIDRAGEQPIVVPPITGVQPVDPTGSGDAFRAGFLAAVGWGLGLERAAQIGNLIAVHALETVGPQEYELKPGPLADRLEAAYGPEAAADLAAHYS